MAYRSVSRNLWISGMILSTLVLAASCKKIPKPEFESRFFFTPDGLYALELPYGWNLTTAREELDVIFSRAMKKPDASNLVQRGSLDVLFADGQIEFKSIRVDMATVQDFQEATIGMSDDDVLTALTVGMRGNGSFGQSEIETIDLSGRHFSRVTIERDGKTMRTWFTVKNTKLVMLSHTISSARGDAAGFDEIERGFIFSDEGIARARAESSSQDEALAQYRTLAGKPGFWVGALDGLLYIPRFLSNMVLRSNYALTQKDNSGFGYWSGLVLMALIALGMIGGSRSKG